jgi:hypothetical protein
MTNKEVICTFMEPFPDPKYGNAKSVWWPLAMKFATDRLLPRYTRELDLDALHEVEARLTDEQWIEYGSLINLSGNQNHYYMKRLIHASTEQKIKVLTAVLRQNNDKRILSEK